jgi:hypothetical protein
VFPETGTFLVYAYGPNAKGYYSTSICQRTKPAEAAKEEIAILDALAAEAGQTSERSRAKRQ